MIPIKKQWLFQFIGCDLSEEILKKYFCEQPTDSLIMGQILSYYYKTVLFSTIVSNDSTKTMTPTTERQREKSWDVIKDREKNSLCLWSNNILNIPRWLQVLDWNLTTTTKELFCRFQWMLNKLLTTSNAPCFLAETLNALFIVGHLLYWLALWSRRSALDYQKLDLCLP